MSRGSEKILGSRIILALDLTVLLASSLKYKAESKFHVVPF